MKAVVIHGPGDVRVEECEIQTLGPDDVRIRVRAGGICGSDVHYYKDGGFGSVRLREPMILGHEVAGDVEAVGAEVNGLRPGDHVVVNPSLPCRTCRYCLRGMPNQCLELRFYGSAMPFPHEQGAFREVLVCAASQTVVLPPALSFSSAAFAEPLAVALHAAAQAGSLLGARVLVTGIGPIGALVVMVARRAGALEIVATDLVAAPLAVAARIGVDRTLDLTAEPTALEPYREGRGYFDVVFEASGSGVALASAIPVTRAGGRIVQIGLGGGVILPMDTLVAREITLCGTFRFHEEFALAAHLIASGAIDVTPLLTDRIPLAEARRAMELAADRARAMKVQLVI